MVEADSVYYVFISIVIVLFFIVAIRILFQQDTVLDNHRRRKFDKILQAYYHQNRSILVAAAVFIFMLYALWQVWAVLMGYAPQFRPIYMLLGFCFVVQFFVASLSRSYKHKLHKSARQALDAVVIVPVYNEDETSLRECVESLFAQTILPKEIHIVDDGSKHDYRDFERHISARADELNITLTWTRQENAGKRAAHITALNQTVLADNSIIVTVDSDGHLDNRAIEEGLVPFEDITVMSVAGLVIAKNAQENMLARITDNLFVSAQQLIDRSFMSQFHSVLVNSGGLAFYRSNVIKKSLESGYDNETFFGAPVKFSDDSYFTLFALLEGKAVQQPSAIVFADMPIKLSHHIRQQLRWARGSFIRSWWRIRHLSFGSFGFLRQVVGWIVFVALFVVTFQVLIVMPIMTQKIPPLQVVVIPFLFSYLQSTRYFSVKRSDMTMRSQIITFLLSPVAIIWSIFILRPLRLYGMVTCLNTGWGTRQSVEIVRK